MNYRLIANSTTRKLIINLILHFAKFIGSLLNITFEALSYSSGFDCDNFDKSHKNSRFWCYVIYGQSLAPLLSSFDPLPAEVFDAVTPLQALTINHHLTIV